MLWVKSCNSHGSERILISLITKEYIWDASFNRLVGEISGNILGRSLRYVFLTGNMLSGNIPDVLLIEGATIDLSYNNFTWQEPNRPTCRSNMNLHLNLFRSSSTGNTLKGRI
nr:probable LRR receptor-like serine/threonine-protein kinase RFK1 isoform X2 [Tanacetum cinerariifolium]